MAVPDFQSFLLPLLKQSGDGQEHSRRDLQRQIAKDMDLSDEDRQEKLPGGANKYENRLAWATVYLVRANCLERVHRGIVRITPRGQQVLAENPQRVSVKILRQFPEFRAFHQGAGVASDPAATETVPSTRVEQEDTQTPEEALEESYRKVQNVLANDVLDAVKRLSPEAFEQLVVKLLVAMGYGGSIDDAGRAVGKSGDEGIDGIIKEDKLGLDSVYIQAKKWEGVVGRPVVQSFAGSLEGHRARKGVMLTTSGFSQDAKDYVQKIERKIVLIDGKQLVQLMIEHNVGVTVTKSYTLKKVDQDFFEAE